eukprot:scaffold109499_cov14-Tisochrysis_lutea.AAC.1
MHAKLARGAWPSSDTSIISCSLRFLKHCRLLLLFCRLARHPIGRKVDLHAGCIPEGIPFGSGS